MGSVFEDIYGIYKILSDKKGRICGQDSVINASMWLGVPISQDILYKKGYPNINFIRFY